MPAAPAATAEAYREQRARDWAAFARGSAPLADYWARWEARSFGWKAPIDFVQPFGRDHAEAFAPLAPLLAELRSLPEVEVPPVEWLHTTWIRVGFLRAADVMWSQVETFYVNAAPRLRRIPPARVRLGGISVADDERVYLGVDDGGMYREARRQAALGVPKVHEVLQDDPLVTPTGDAYMPAIDIALFTGAGSRERVLAAIAPHRDIDLGEVALTHLKLARLPMQPHSHYEPLDVVAEIPMLGEAHRGGYHN